MSQNEKHFTEKSFTFFTINYVVGVGFLTTIGSLVLFNYWSYLIIALAGFVIFAVSLLFSRLANNFKEHYGGSYTFAKHINDGNLTPLQAKVARYFSFFVGWNQFLQAPILSSVSPLFLASTIISLIDKNIENYNVYVWVIRVLSLLFFVFLIFLSTIGLKTNKKIILITSSIKWFTVLLGIGILVYSVISTPQYSANLMQFKSHEIGKINAQLIFANALLFVYAFAGTEDVSAMAKDVKFKNFRKILLISFAFVITFYFVTFTLLLGFDVVKTKQGLIGIYSVFLVFGSILFIMGYLANDVTAKITISVSTARKLVPMCEDGHLFSSLTKRNTKGEFRNAIWFTTGITLATLVLFWLLNIFLGNQTQEQMDNFFETAILGSSLGLLVEDLCSFISAFVLDKRKIIKKIPIWEKIIYILAIILILVMVISYFFPQIYGIAPNVNTIVVVSIYFGFLILGFILKLTNKFIAPKIIKLYQKKFKKS
ncbi:amino acid permease [Mycoplasma buteonis]|uniref:amino acid permease n=1 Tax=Mycoplasma buteonis TaxID=171280 RepID=UPI000562554C|nr:APC family permease [Mycoplasma buteonis]